MKKVYHTWNDLESAAEHIALAMYKDMWKPHYVVGVTQGGLPLATVLSHKISVPLIALSVDLKNSVIGCETNCWLSEWAFGYNDSAETGITGARWDLSLRKNILVVNSINNTGETFNWIKNDWQSSCFPKETDAWNTVWHRSVRFATMVNNTASSVMVDYNWKEINSTEDKSQQVFPWEKKQ
jgi:uncharacterized protein